MKKTPHHLLLALGLTLLAGCSTNPSSTSNTAPAQLTLPLLEDSASGTTNATGSCWASTSPTTSYRIEHTATLLPDGKVLVAGGYWTYQNSMGLIESVHLASTEVYDPASGTWSAAGPMALARRGHTATLLPNGKVLVAGGYNDRGPLSSVEVYDPASGTWSATGSMSSPRFVHTATLLPDEKVLVAGGLNNEATLGSAEVYDPASGTWSPVGSMAQARRGHGATLLPNGKVLTLGGSTMSAFFASAEVYDPASGTWSSAGSLSLPRRFHTVTLLPNGKVLVAGGRDYLGSAVALAEVYDPVSGTWSTTGSMSLPRHSHTATLLPNGKVLVAGGYNRGALASAEVYDPASGTWSATGSMSLPRQSHTATLLPNGKMLVVAGSGGSFGYLVAAELYSCGVEEGATCPDGSPHSEVSISSGELSLTLQCPQEMTLECGVRTWVDPGATATDGVSPLEVHKYNSGDDDGDGVPGAEDPDDYGPGPNAYAEGTYTVEYIAWSPVGTVSAVRTVHVQDSTPPVLKLKGPEQMTHVCGSSWVDPGVEASDMCDGDLTPTVQTTGYVNGWVEGTYTLTYSLTDNAGNSAPPLMRTVEVVDCPW